MKDAAEILLQESYQIADGETREIGTSAHVKVLVAELRAVSEKEHNVTMNYLIADRNLTKIVKAADRLLLVARILETVGPFNLSPETYDLAAINNLEQVLLQAKGGAMTLRLSRQVPARIETITALWCRKNFIPMSQRYRLMRRKMGKPRDSCFWCGHEFIDGEMMALAALEGEGNKTLCQQCADEMLVTEEQS